MKCLVAGGAGFIGSHVCEQLLGAGHEVLCLDNFLTGSSKNVAHLKSLNGFSMIHADVAEAPPVQADLIIHLASPASPIDYERHPLETMRANALGTWRLLELADGLAASLLFASTSEVYGDPLVHPQPETYWGNVDPVGPRSCYDESKRFAEALIMASRRANGVRANIVRIFNTYGPRMRAGDGRAIPQFLAAALRGEPLTVHGDGLQTRSFCYVGDLVRGLLDVALDGDVDGEIFNVGNPAEITILDVARTIQGMYGPRSSVVFVDRPSGDPARRKPEIRRMRDRYGWNPQVDLREGLRLTVESMTNESTVAAFRQ